MADRARSKMDAEQFAQLPPPTRLLLWSVCAAAGVALLGAAAALAINLVQGALT